MQALALILAGIHAIGAALGAGGVTFAEIFYTKATADGRIDRREQEYFRATFWALQWGLLTVLISGIALTIIQYFLPNSPQAVLYAPLWMQNTLALVIIIAAWFVSRRAFPWWVGSSLIFAGWWMMLVLDAYRTASVSYFWLWWAYALLFFLSALGWGYARTIAHGRYVHNTKRHHS